MDGLSVFVINLDKDVRRLAWMTQALERFDIPFTRLAGIEGARLDAERQAYHGDSRREHLSPAEIGCLLSHINAWRAVASGTDPFGLILEDDVHFAPDFGSFLRAMVPCLPPTGLWVHKLETFNARMTLERSAAFKVGHRSAFLLHTNHAGAAAYIINQDMARYCLKEVPRLRHLADTELFDPARRIINDHACYQWRPSPCIQDMNLGYVQKLTSNLADDRSDMRDLHESAPRLRDKVRDLLRPSYTQAYSALLSFKGRQRSAIPFG